MIEADLRAVHLVAHVLVDGTKPTMHQRLGLLEREDAMPPIYWHRPCMARVTSSGMGHSPNRSRAAPVAMAE